MSSDYKDLWANGLWKNNAGLVQLLGLCPLLAVTGTVINGLGLGLATTLILVGSNLVVSLIRNSVRPEIRLPVFVLVIASFVTAVELAMSAWFHELYKVLGIFIPLIVTNCLILGRAEAYASRNGPSLAILDGLAMGTGFTFVLLALGAIREVIGFGTLLSQAHLMFGKGSEWLTIELFSDYNGFLLAILPPGAFFALGFLVAGKNWLDRRAAQKQTAASGVVAGAEA